MPNTSNTTSGASKSASNPNPQLYHHSCGLTSDCHRKFSDLSALKEEIKILERRTKKLEKALPAWDATKWVLPIDVHSVEIMKEKVSYLEGEIEDFVATLESYEPEPAAPKEESLKRRFAAVEKRILALEEVFETVYEYEVATS